MCIVEAFALAADGTLPTRKPNTWRRRYLDWPCRGQTPPHADGSLDSKLLYTLYMHSYIHRYTFICILVYNIYSPMGEGGHP